MLRQGQGLRTPVRVAVVAARCLLVVVVGLALGPAACGGVYAGPQCDSPLISCGQQCVDATRDPSNCGGCGTRCGDTDVCIDGECQLFCGPGSNVCGGRCVETAFNPMNCGGCGTACVAGAVCSNGRCGDECTGGTLRCGNRCVDADVDPKHCGGCGKACGATEVCYGGVCLDGCPTGTAECSGRCVSIDYDPMHCGACGNECRAGELCANRVCADECRGGTQSCDHLCVDPRWDPANCGGCGIVCESGEVCSLGECGLTCSGGTTKCGSRCVDTAWDPGHCGACANACDLGLVCSEGECTDHCTGGSVRCGDQCVFLESDWKHCGKCFNVCPPSQVCANGECIPECPIGLTNCDGDCVDLDFADDHCGACGKPCPGGKVCWRRTCLVPTLDGDLQGPWELSKIGGPPPLSAITEYTPASVQGFYGGLNRDWFRYAAGFSQLSDPPKSISLDPLAGLAWVGQSLFYPRAAFVFRYRITSGSWDSIAGGYQAATGTQAAHDDGGTVYYMSNDGRIVRFAADTGTLAIDPQPIVPETEPWRPRLAYDTLTKRLYVAPRFDARDFYEYDPKSRAVLSLPPPPNDAIGTAFCSDRSGHLYTRGDAGFQTWQYTVYAPGWKRVFDAPFSMHPGGVCTVEANGWLYLQRSHDVARIHLL